MAHKAHVTQHHAQAQSSPITALQARLKGPGGLYNIGNVIGLASGIFFALFRGTDTQAGGYLDSLIAYLAGNPGNAALSIAMVLFIWSGENYHRAAQLNSDRVLRKADMLSGIAALFLAVSLVSNGNLALAITSTVLLAGGKFGNAIFFQQGWPIKVETQLPGSVILRVHTNDVFRMAVIASRVPAIAALAVAIAAGLSGPVLTSGVLEATILLICYLLWTKADVLLMRS